jgi:hypothetical protein
LTSEFGQRLYGSDLLGWGRRLRGWAPCELGEIDRGVAGMEAGIEALRRIGARFRQAFTEATLAQGYARPGRSGEALATLHEALAAVERRGEHVDDPEVLRLKGEIVVLGGLSNASDAAQCFRAAIELARHQGAKVVGVACDDEPCPAARETGSSR